MFQVVRAQILQHQHILWKHILQLHSMVVPFGLFVCGFGLPSHGVFPLECQHWWGTLFPWLVGHVFEWFPHHFFWEVEHCHGTSCGQSCLVIGQCCSLCCVKCSNPHSNPISCGVSYLSSKLPPWPSPHSPKGSLLFHALLWRGWCIMCFFHHLPLPCITQIGGHFHLWLTAHQRPWRVGVWGWFLHLWGIIIKGGGGGGGGGFFIEEKKVLPMEWFCTQRRV